MKIAVCFDYDGLNSRYMKPKILEAIASLGWQKTSVADCDAAIMWGPQPDLALCKSMGKPALVMDFPYWNRAWKERNGQEFYKIGLNSQHPADYFLSEKHSSDRYMKTCGKPIIPWKREGKHILFAGMGIKAAAQYGYAPQQWERSAIAVIRKHTSMPILYRQKQNGRTFSLIGDTVNDINKNIEDSLKDAFAVVCHHGNPSVDGLFAGVPCFMKGIGVATHMAETDFTKIMHPKYPDNRQEFFNNLAHWQWSVPEIRSGEALQSYRDRGFI